MNKQDCINDLVCVRGLLGKIPTRIEYRQHGKYGSTTLQRVFGSYDKAKFEAFGDDAKCVSSVVNVPCNYCGKIVQRTPSEITGKVYCSHSCSAKVNNNRLGTGVFDKNPTYCLCCGGVLNKQNKTYCNNVCHKKHQYDVFIEKWKNGEPITTQGTPIPIKRYLFDKYDNKCSRCGWCEINPITGRTTIEVEHIDGDSSNNNEENLTVLCPNCHSLTPTYKALNKGRGRAYRRQRYKEGKSF